MVWRDVGLNPGLPRPLANTLPTRPNVSLLLLQAVCIFVWTWACTCSKYCVFVNLWLQQFRLSALPSLRSILPVTKFMRVLSSICYNPKLASDWLKQSHLNWTNLQFVIRRSHIQFLTSHKTYFLNGMST